MDPIKRLAFASAAAIALTVSLALPALADAPVLQYDDGSPFVGTYAPTVVPAWKQRLYDLFLKMKAGTLTSADATQYNAIVIQQNLDPLGKTAPMVASAVDGTATPMVAYPTSNSLTQTQAVQEKSYYCGPATGFAIVKSWHNEFGTSLNSVPEGWSLTQPHLASDSYMMTDSQQRTDWLDHDMSRSLNRWLGVSYYVEYSTASVTDLENHVEWSIYTDHMEAADTNEDANGVHYNHHPKAKPVAHWLSTYGYSNSGHTLTFQDPAGGGTALGSLGSDWADVNKYFSMSSSSSFFYMQQNGVVRGIVW